MLFAFLSLIFVISCFIAAAVATIRVNERRKKKTKDLILRLYGKEKDKLQRRD